MKKVILTVGMFIAMAGASYAQAPEEFNYQAVARDVAGNVLPNQTVGVEISILENSSSGTVIYTETHAPTTNNFGLLNLNIGRGTVVSGTFNTIDWANNNYFVQISMDMTGGNSYNLMGTSQLISVPYALHAKTANSVANDMVDDADADPTNELQNLSISNDTIFISNGNHAVLPTAVDTDEQTLSLNNDSLFISNGNGVSLSAYAVDLVDDADNDPTNEIETWSTLSGIPVDLADGIDNVDDADADPSNEIQDISLSGTSLSITNGSTVDLSSLQDGVNDADADPNNEIQDISLSGTSLSITNGSNVDLSTLVNDADADPTNEIQDISLSGTNISITSGSTVDLSSLQDGVNDADANPTNEIQDISLSGTNLSITSGSTIDLSSLQDGVNDADANPTNEIQDISLSGTNLSITSGSTIDLSSLQDGVNDADASPTNEIQTLSLSGSSLSISGGNSVTLPSGGDGIYGGNGSVANNTNVTLLGALNFDGGTFFIDGSGNEVAIGSSTASAKLHITQDGTSISDGIRLSSSAANGQDWYYYMNTNDDLIIRDDASDVMCFQNGTDFVGINTNSPTANLSVSGTANKTGGGTWATFSDKRVKKDIVKYTDGLSELMKINTVKFKYIKEFAMEQNPEKEFVGIIAQDMQKIAPYMIESVTYTPEKPTTSEGDDASENSISGKSGLTPGQELLQYDGSALVYMLINSVQEQQGLISNQQAEIDALKAELEAIKELLKK